MHRFGLVFFLLLNLRVQAQFSDAFTDGDFTANPPWSGDAANFTVNAGQLQSNGPNAAARLSLSIPSRGFDHVEWTFYAKLTFNPSDANHARVYLMSDQADLKSASLNGYFIRIGEDGSNDGVDLWRQQGSVTTKIVDGPPGTVATNPAVRVRVVRDAAGTWSVSADPTGGTAFALQGSVTDNAVRATAFFGVLCVHTTTNRQRFFFDDFGIREAPITLGRAEARDATRVDVTFSNVPEAASARTAANYDVNNGIIVSQADQDATDPSRVHLTLATPLVENTVYVLTVNNVRGAEGSLLAANSQASFRYVAPVRYHDVIITEIFADESPGVGLPDAEFVEVYNRSNRTLSLNRFRLVDDGGFGTFPDVVIRPGEYLILCSTSSVSKFASFGKAIGLANFSLNNTGETLGLRNAQGALIASVAYSDQWYNSSVKKNGGWSLEMIDVNNPCGEAGNWVASENSAGGTPGKPNSVAAAKPDLSPPQLLRVEVLGPNRAQLVFNEKLDSLSAVTTPYQITPDIRIGAVAVESPGFQRVDLTLNPALQAQTVYILNLRGLTDCAGNLMVVNTQATLVLPQPGDSGDVVLNEVLFNPRGGGVDFVEIYNRSAKHVSLKGWQLANVDDGLVANAKAITADNRTIAPGQYYALTTDGRILRGQYPKAAAENFLVVPDLPSYSDGAGTVVLLNDANRPIDRFDYDEGQHLVLINDQNGVSLERISFDSPANAPGSWRSAASTEDYATPGYRNSQYQPPTANPGGLVIDPPVFTPDEDGQSDFTTLSYAFAGVGNVATIRIFDARGREVKRLAQNQTLATEGAFYWDGTNERGEKVRTGYYIVHVELFDPSGNTQQFKEKVVVGAKY
ncbi:MAG: lamin tail domain-containing protein [Ferruginibacter sp.]|nr:lamin tail domain-containing protein [Cytophagales bacterium]